ncbi:hypothetical protein, partial [Nitratidesulfovibrio sp. 1201_IL3209]|uniref:hypothetical protein n=1 Tax=Nitratidesulfovibrio sp. 1201_IL3209 TaxID=3084053 RepID=UPI002FD9605C
GGSLYLRGTGVTALRDNLTVGGSLDLRGTGVTALPDNLTVGGSLYLRGTGVTALPDNLTVGGYLDLRGTGVTEENARRVREKSFPENFILSWRGGKYVSVDGIFSEVLSRKGNVWKARGIGEKKITYIVTDGHGKWSHGDTLKAAKDDLLYKIGSRDKSLYAEHTMDSTLPLEQAIEAYRVITGACAAGTRGFVESLSVVKAQYTIREICELTKGRYGHNEFTQFFAR